jgi:hypothetical protein
MATSPTSRNLTSATFLGSQILTKDVSFFMRYCLWDKNENWAALDSISKKFLA